MIVYLKVITRNPEKCAGCGKDLVAGYHGYIEVAVYYKDRIEALNTIICQACKDANK